MSRSAEQVGRVLSDRYRLTRPIGTGASAHVYVAEDLRMRRRVAVKVLHPVLAGDQSFLRRFRAEVEAIARLRHRNIVQVHDAGEDDDAPYLVMELLEGGSLRSLLDSGYRLNVNQAVAVAADAASALAYAHARGLVHRDIKPANLLFDEYGSLSVADFGVARALAEATWTEPAGVMIGTARYAAPEQLRGAALDGRADVYALALVIVEAVTGAVPFAVDTPIGTLMGRADRPVPVPPELEPLAAVLRRAGTVDPAERVDAAGLAAALDQVARTLSPPGRLPLPGLPGRGDVDSELERTELPSVRRAPVAPRDLTVYEPSPEIIPDQRGDEIDEVAGDNDEDDDTGPTSWSGAAPVALPLPPTGRPTPLRRGDAAERTPERGQAAEAQPGPLGTAEGAGPGLAVHGEARSRLDGDLATAIAPGPPQAPKRRRRRGRWIALGAVVLLLAGGGTAVAIIASQPPPTYPVPPVVGQSESAAAVQLTTRHLAERAAPTYSMAAKGRVIGQSPAPGVRLHAKTVVVLDVSIGPKPVNVPSLYEKTRQQAESLLTSGGLRLGLVTNAPDETVPAGLIVSWTDQNVTAPVAYGTAINLVISSGKPERPVPPVAAGATWAQESAVLQGAGLVAVETEGYSTTVSQGQVISVTPPAGTMEKAGASVTVLVSKGPHLVTIPATIVGQSVSAAANILEQDGIYVYAVQGNPLSAVVSSVPPIGSSVLYGKAIQLVT